MGKQCYFSYDFSVSVTVIVDQSGVNLMRETVKK